MKNIKQLQQIVNETDEQLFGINYQNREAAITLALAKLQAQPELLREIVTDAIYILARENEARAIDRMVAKARRSTQ